MDKLEETDEGYYVQHGDIREWHWKPGHEPAIPEGEFNPRSADVVVNKTTSVPEVVPKKTTRKKSTAKAKK